RPMLLFVEIGENRRARRHLDAGPVGPIGTVSPTAGWRLRRQGQWVWLVVHTGSGRTRLGRRKQPRRCRLYEVPAHAHAKPHPFRTLRNELPIPPQGVPNAVRGAEHFRGPPAARLRPRRGPCNGKSSGCGRGAANGLFRPLAASSHNGVSDRGIRTQRMATNLPLQSGGQLVVGALRAHGVEMAFSVAGESYLEV